MYDIYGLPFTININPSFVSINLPYIRIRHGSMGRDFPRDLAKTLMIRANPEEAILVHLACRPDAKRMGARLDSVTRVALEN